MALFKRWADEGLFRKITDWPLYEFKGRSARMLGDIRSGPVKTFVVAHGALKRGRQLKDTEFDRAVRILRAHDPRRSES